VLDWIEEGKGTLLGGFAGDSEVSVCGSVDGDEEGFLLPVCLRVGTCDGSLDLIALGALDVAMIGMILGQ
jgi:hypothetical protein